MNAPASMFCYFSVTAGDCVVLKDAAGQTMSVKSLPTRVHYADFARRVMRSKAWRISDYGPGSFTLSRR